MSSKIQRRDPCPCGSGKKYKNCCGRQGAGSSSEKGSRLKFIAPIIVIVGGGIAAYMIFSEPTIPTTAPISEEFSTEVLSKRVQPIQSQPAGTAPEGKVWSEEHGHWHDEQGAASDFATKFTPQPPGLAPEGKVWSEEHGHWHDEPGAISETPGEPTPQPPGPAPEGKAWSEEHGHWHDAPIAARPSGSSTVPTNIKPSATTRASAEPTPQPPGPAPEGKVWSSEHGHWHNAPATSTPSESGKNPITITPAKPPETGSEDPD